MLGLGAGKLFVPGGTIQPAARTASLAAVGAAAARAKLKYKNQIRITI